jgi:hypothetical protein
MLPLQIGSLHGRNAQIPVARRGRAERVNSSRSGPRQRPRLDSLVFLSGETARAGLQPRFCRGLCRLALQRTPGLGGPLELGARQRQRPRGVGHLDSCKYLRTRQ